MQRSLHNVCCRLSGARVNPAAGARPTVLHHTLLPRHAAHMSCSHVKARLWRGSAVMPACHGLHLSLQHRMLAAALTQMIASYP